MFLKCGKAEMCPTAFRPDTNHHALILYTPSTGTVRLIQVYWDGDNHAHCLLTGILSTSLVNHSFDLFVTAAATENLSINVMT